MVEKLRGVGGRNFGDKLSILFLKCDMTDMPLAKILRATTGQNLKNNLSHQSL